MIDLVAPFDSPQTWVPPVHPLAPELLSVLRKRGSAPAPLWAVINELANAPNPDSRAQRRCWRLRYLGALSALIRARIVFRHGALIASHDFAFMPKPRS